MLSRLYYFSKHSYPLPCYFLWSARLALTFFFPPSSHALPSTSFSPPSSILSASDQRAETDRPDQFTVAVDVWNSAHLFPVIRGQGVHSGSDLLDSPFNMPWPSEEGFISGLRVNLHSVNSPLNSKQELKLQTHDKGRFSKHFFTLKTAGKSISFITLWIECEWTKPQFMWFLFWADF